MTTTGRGHTGPAVPTDPAMQAHPATVTTRGEFADALTALRVSAGLSVREVVTRSGGLHGTIAGWFSGQHLPTRASLPMFDAVLGACGVGGGDHDAVEAVDADNDSATLEQWHEALDRVRRKRRAPTRRSPYRGLEAFSEEDAEWFFGRDDLTRRIVDRIGGGAPLIVIGASGSGKSSVLRAGVVPRLRADGRSAVVTTPGDALGALAELEELDHPVLIVDQFEELWTRALSADARETIIAALTATPVAVVLGLRADFYGPASAEPALTDSLSSPVIVGPLEDEQLRAVITDPADKAGVTVTEPLVELLIDEARPHGATAGPRPGALPLLSHTLLSTWNTSRQSTLTVEDYYAVGGIGGAVDQTAEEVFAALSQDQRELAPRVFLRLVVVDDEADLVLRRRITRAELPVGHTGDSGAGTGPGNGPHDEADAEAIVDAFVAQRLITVGDDTIEISHEILLSAWDRLRTWVEGNRAGLIVQRQLAEAAAAWAAADRDPDALLAGRRLAVACEWAESSDTLASLSPLEQEFLDAGVAAEEARSEHEQHRYRVLRGLVAALAFVTVVAVVAAILAGVSRYQTGLQRTAAQHARNEAMARQAATQAESLREHDPALAAQLALASYRITPTLESRSALLDATAVHSATRIVGPTGQTTAAYAPGTDWFAVASADGRVRIYTDKPRSGPADSTPISTIEAFDGELPSFAMAASPGGALLAVGGQGGAGLWDTSDPTSPRRVATLVPSGDDAPSVQTLQFTPDGAMLLAATSDGDLLRWRTGTPAQTPSAQTPAALPPVPLPGGGPHVLALSPDGTLLATGGQGGALQILDTAHLDAPDGPGEPLYSLPPDPDSTERILSLAFAPDDATLYAGTTGRVVRRWDVTDPRAPAPQDPLGGFDSYVNGVAVSPDGLQVAAGSSDNTVRIWRTGDGDGGDSGGDSGGDTVADTILPGPAIITTVQFSGDGDTLLTGGLDGLAWQWPLPGPVLGGAYDKIFTNPISEDGALLLTGTGSHDTGEHLWDISDPDAPSETAILLPVDGDAFTGATDLAESGDLAASGTTNGGVYIWDTADPAAPRLLSRTPSVVDGIVNVVSFSPDARLLAVSDQSANGVQLLDISDPAAPRQVASFDASNYPQWMTFSPDGATLSVATADSTDELWDVQDPAHPVQRAVLTGFDTYAQASDFSPDGRLLAVGSADQSVRIWDVTDIDSPTPVAVIPELADAVYSLDFNADGTRLVAAVGNGEVDIWAIDDAGDATLTSALTAYPGRAWDARFGGDGLLAASGSAKVTQLWSTDPDAAAQEICDTRGTPLTDAEWKRYLPDVPRHNLCE